jgi:hypothetical protein
VHIQVCVHVRTRSGGRRKKESVREYVCVCVSERERASEVVDKLAVWAIACLPIEYRYDR